MKTTLYAAVFAGTFLLASCSGKPKDSADVAQDANETMVDSSATALQGDDMGDKKDDSEFMVKAAEGGMFEIETSKLAKEKGTDATVKQIADMMITDHTKASDELKGIAMNKKVELPVALGSDKQGKLDDLSKMNGVDFDHKYMSLMQDAHEDDVDLFKKNASDAMDADVKAFAAKTLPIIEHHLSMVKPAEEHEDDRKDKM